MPKLRYLGAIAAFVLIALSNIGASAGKDYAVVIGVDSVNGVASPLKGAANDAKDFAERLRQRGIEPVLLINGQATRAAVTSAIARGAKSDHLVLYFAGYGSGPNTPRLLTAEDSKGLPLEEIDKALVKAAAGSTTVILDTSFSGLRSDKDGPSLFTSRYYQPVNGSRELGKIGANAADLPGLSHDKVCYITAGRFNEDAFEDTFDGKSRGVFTNYLCDRLSGDGKIAWQSVQWDVAAQVAAHVDDQQHPNFPVEYLANAALEGDVVGPAEYGKGAESTPAPATNPASGSMAQRTLWTLFNVDNVDPRLVSLSMKPNKAEVMVEEPLEFELTVGKAGYLIVVEHSVEGTLKPIFPRNGDIATAEVRAGQKVVIPEPAIVAFADRPGKERLKALLFTDIEAARALLAGLDAPEGDMGDVGATFGNASRRLQDRGIRFTHSDSASRGNVFGKEVPISDLPVTADLTFKVIDK